MLVINRVESALTDACHLSVEQLMGSIPSAERGEIELALGYLWFVGTVVWVNIPDRGWGYQLRVNYTRLSVQSGHWNETKDLPNIGRAAMLSLSVEKQRKWVEFFQSKGILRKREQLSK